MATPITGAISLSQVNTELGLASTTAISLNDTNVRRLFNQFSGAVDMGSGRAAAYLNSTVVNQNLLVNFFGSSGTVANYKLYINTGGVIGATAGNTALTLGQFASGSTIVINNFGAINGAGGAGGAPTGGAGGDAINANFPNQTVTINNQSGAFIRGGGGGGGRGGTGGTGGTGGGGQFNSDSADLFCVPGNPKGCSPEYFWQAGATSPPSKGQVYILGRWAGSTVINGNYPSATTQVGSYLRGAYRNTDGYGNDRYGIIQRTVVNTNGGAGGAGGAGGNGGRGQGHDGANAGGSAGAGGSPGAAGGTNAGAGGAGGTGGTGGTGGAYGASGSNGNTGATGNTGANGNRTAGLAGSAGAGGSAAGAAGRYLVRGANAVTLNNSGTVAGGLA